MAHRLHQRGASLLEALIAFLALSLGMLGTTRLHGELRLHSDLARQRSEAVRLGQQDIEQLRAFSSAAPASGASAYDDIASATLTGNDTRTPYRIVRSVREHGSGYKAAAVDVAWNDRRGDEQRVQLASLISRSDPAYAGALAVRSPPAPPPAPFGRHPAIPLGARDLGDGRSALKQPGKALVVVFDNVTGLATSRCSAADTGTQTRHLTASALHNCSQYRVLTVGGHVRFSLGASPDADNATDTPLPLAIDLTPADTRGAPADCIAEALQTVRYTHQGVPHRATVPLGAPPGDYGATAWLETYDRYIAYTCFVAADGATSRWSGRTTIAPDSWTLGTTVGDHRVCRYAADYDGNGAVDRNDEHPADYTNVDVPLLHQNFLVIRGDQACPAGRFTAMDPVARTSHHHTEPHQP